VIADAAASGVGLEKLDEMIGTPEIRARVEADVVSGRDSGVHSTPSFFFNGTLFDGRYDATTLRREIDKAMANKAE
jgi:protein-disulfide isomerase